MAVVAICLVRWVLVDVVDRDGRPLFFFIPLQGDLHSFFFLFFSLYKNYRIVRRFVSCDLVSWIFFFFLMGSLIPGELTQ